MADIKLKNVDKNKIAIVDTIDEATLQVLYRLKQLK